MSPSDSAPTPSPSKPSPAPEDPGDWFGQTIGRGASAATEFVVSESYSGRDVVIPLQVTRGAADGPTVLVTAALHGDELNGTGAIRTLLSNPDFHLAAGTLIMVPVLNVLGFERHSRYLPDRRDLNRVFPGSAGGSMASRLAKVIFDRLISRCDFGIDLHTASVRRTNFPNCRADLSNPACERIATAFGAGLILNNRGPRGSLRREATRIGCPTIILEGGEVWKVESSVVESMTRGITNVLQELEMLPGKPDLPDSQAVIQQTRWLRAERGGFLTMHVSPGDTVTEGQPIATNSNLLCQDQNRLVAPFSGIVLGMTTLPAVQPGEPVVHLGRLAGRRSARRLESQVEADNVQRTAHEHLATNLQVVAAAPAPPEA